MTTQYTPILKLALPVTGELSGTWGTVVNDNITSMVEQAVAGLSTINTWTANAHTLTTADGTSSEARCAMLVLATGAGGTALTAAGEVICPAASKLYVVKNGSAYAVTVKTSAGTGVAIPAGDTAFVFCDGTNVNACVTTIVNGHISGNLTVDGNTTLGNATSDTITATARFNTDLLPSTDNARDLGSTANSWRTLYCETSVIAANITISGNTISSTDTNGNITLAPNGTGDVQLDADTIRVGDSGANVTITSNGAGDLILNTNSGTNSGSITIEDGANGNIALAPNGTGQVTISTALDLTNLEVTNIKAKDGTAAIVLTDSTGAVTISTALTANGGAVFNENGANVDFRVEGDTDANLIFADASADTVGIGTGSPGYKLDVNGTFGLATGQTGNIGVFGANSATADTYFRIRNTAGAFDIGTSSTGHYFYGQGDLPLQFFVNAAEKMRLASATGGVGALGIGYTSLTSVGDSGLAVLGNVGIGTSSPSYKLDVQASTAVTQTKSTTGTNAAYYVANNTGGDFYIGRENSAGTTFSTTAYSSVLWAAGAYPMSFFTDGTERVRITSGGDVGIGTNAPSSKLQVSGAIRVTGSDSTAVASSGVVRQVGSTMSFVSYGANASTPGGFSLTGLSSDASAGDVRVTIDASGNLGLGVTPSGWTRPAIQGGATSTVFYYAATNVNVVAANSFFNGANRYIQTGYATQYAQSSGAHLWLTAPSWNGTGSDEITFTQAMTLDASGNLVVGDTSPPSANFRGFFNGSVASDVLSVGVRNTDSSGVSRLILGNNAGAFRCSFGYTGSTSSVYSWGASAGYIGTEGSEPFIFITSGTERARITSGGDFLVGNTGGTGNFTLYGSAGDIQKIYSTQASSASYTLVSMWSGATTPTSPTGTLRVNITTDGGIANYQANDSNLSDARLKTDIYPVASYWDKIKSLEIVSFKYKDQTDDIANIGVIAQQVEAVAPEFVSNEGFGEATEGEAPYKTIYTTDMYHAAIKALQEAMARIETLEAEVAALKGA